MSAVILKRRRMTEATLVIEANLKKIKLEKLDYMKLLDLRNPRVER